LSCAVSTVWGKKLDFIVVYTVVCFFRILLCMIVDFYAKMLYNIGNSKTVVMYNQNLWIYTSFHRNASRQGLWT
jgi:hypothetical protein